MLKALIRQLLHAGRPPRPVAADSILPTDGTDQSQKLALLRELVLDPAPHINDLLEGYGYARRLELNDLALSLLERAAEVRSADFTIQANLSTLKSAAGDLAGALRCSISSIELAPDRAEPRYNLGLLRYEMGEFTEAERLFREAIDLAPAFEPAQNSLICLQDRMHGVEPGVLIAQRREWAA